MATNPREFLEEGIPEGAPPDWAERRARLRAAGIQPATLFTPLTHQPVKSYPRWFAFLLRLGDRIARQ